MGLTEMLADAAGISLRSVGSLQLVAFKDAEKIVDAAIRAGIAIAGIEGLKVIDGRTVPDMDAIADFSAQRHDASQSGKDAREFICSVGDDEMLFEFTFEIRK